MRLPFLFLFQWSMCESVVAFSRVPKSDFLGLRKCAMCENVASKWLFRVPKVFSWVLERAQCARTLPQNGISGFQKSDFLDLRKSALCENVVQNDLSGFQKVTSWVSESAQCARTLSQHGLSGFQKCGFLGLRKCAMCQNVVPKMAFQGSKE